MKKLPAICGWMSFLLPFVIYLLTLCPTVHWGDSGELITAAYTLGIPHPPGHPLYAIIGKLFTLIPIGSIAWRVNLMSAFFGAVTCFLIYKIILDRLEDSSWKYAAALGGAMFFAFAPTVWDQTTVAETTTLHSAFMMLLTLLGFRVCSRKTLWRNETYSLCLFSFLYGFSMTNHVAGVFFLPAFIYLFLSSYGKRILAPRLLLKMIAVCMAASLVYLYLPIRSLANPPLDWGNPETWSNFWWVVTARQFSQNLVKKPDLLGLPLSLLKMTKDLVRQYTIIGFLLGLLGVFHLFRSERRFLIFTGTVVGILFFVGLNKAFISAYFVPALALLAVCVGIGIQEGITWVRDSAGRFRGLFSLPVFERGLCGLLTAAFILPLGLHYKLMDKSSDYYAFRYGNQILERLPENSFLFTADGYALFILWYLTICEGRGTNVKIINPSWIFGPAALRTAVFDQYPEFRMPDIEKVRAKAILGETLNQRQLLAIQTLLDKNAESNPVFWGIILDQLPFFNHLKCRGIVYQYSRAPIVLSEETVAEAKAYWTGELNLYRKNPAMERTALVEDIYPVELNNQGLMFEELGRDDLSRWFIERALDFNPRYPESRYNLGRLEARDGNYEQAIIQYQVAIRENPNMAVAYYNLGNAYRALDQLDNAFLAYKKAVRCDNEQYQARTAMGQLYARVGQHEDAIKEFQKSLDIAPDYAFALRGLASSFLATGKVSEARCTLQRALRAEPDSAPGLFMLAKFNARVGAEDSAEKALKRSIEIGGDAFLLDALSDEDLKTLARHIAPSEEN